MASFILPGTKRCVNRWPTRFATSTRWAPTPAAASGRTPLGIPNNLFPFITQVAAGRRDKLRVFGQDYPTPDGTGIREHLHVMDLPKPTASRSPTCSTRSRPPS